MKYQCQILDYHGEDWIELEAFDMEHAAELAAEEYYDSDPDDANKFTCEVSVRDIDTFAITKFSITADYSVNFYAREK